MCWDSDRSEAISELETGSTSHKKDAVIQQHTSEEQHKSSSNNNKKEKLLSPSNIAGTKQLMWILDGFVRWILVCADALESFLVSWFHLSSLTETKHPSKHVRTGMLRFYLYDSHLYVDGSQDSDCSFILLLLFFVDLPWIFDVKGVPIANPLIFLCF